MRFCIPVLAFSFALHAQIGGVGQPTGQNPAGAQTPLAASPSEDLCAIQGQVLNSVTGEPLKKANLNLQRTDMTPDMMSVPTSYSTSTDASGKFGMLMTSADRARPSAALPVLPRPAPAMAAARLGLRKRSTGAGKR